MASSFQELPIPAPLRSALTSKGYADPTPVQQAVLDPSHAGQDLLVSSQTGSGKTVAFGLALAETILDGKDRFGPAKRPLALVVAPTRELAQQVQNELFWLYAETGARVRACVGGTDIRREMKLLSEGSHIVVGTPGRLVDHLERKSLNLSELRAVVLDEADEMLDMGFREDLELILQAANPERRTLFFSATFPDEIRKLAATFQKDAKRITATPAEQAHQDIEYRALAIAPREREHAVVNTLRFIDPARALVFCATRESVNHMTANLVERGFQAVAISGELTQSERNRALKELRDGRARVLVATDVAARGLDLPEVSLVIQADLPHDAQVLQHRSGRTGRAGRKGVSVLLVPGSKRRVAERLTRTARVQPKWESVATPEQIEERDKERIHAALGELVAEPAPEDLEIAKALLKTHSAEAIAAALVKQQRAHLPAAEVLMESARLEQGESRRRGWQERVEQGDWGAKPQKRTPRAATEAGPGPGPGRWRNRDEVVPPSRSREAPATGFARSEAPARTPRAAPAGAEDGTSRYKARESRARTWEDEPTDGAEARGGRRGEPVWFRLNVGRERNADPKWLLPLICRRGKVTRDSLGRIEIMDKETRFEVDARIATQFAAAAAMPDKKDPAIRIEKVPAGAAKTERPRFTGKPERSGVGGTERAGPRAGTARSEPRGKPYRPTSAAKHPSGGRGKPKPY